MVQKQATQMAAPPRPSPVTPVSKPRLGGWPVIAIVMTVAFLALLGWVLYPQIVPDEPTTIAKDSVAAWNAGTAADFEAIYAPDVTVQIDPMTTITGIDELVAFSAELPGGFAVEMTGDVTSSPGDAFIAYPWKVTTTDSGTAAGLSVLQIENGLIVEEVHYSL